VHKNTTFFPRISKRSIKKQCLGLEEEAGPLSERQKGEEQKHGERLEGEGDGQKGR
jgi:hypothetical protein